MHSSSAESPPPAATELEVRPFRALTYRRRDPEHLARVSSPAYDLVTPSGRERLAAADPHNIVRLILPLVEPGPGGDGPTDPLLRSAAQAARTLRDWQDGGVLERDRRPAFWLYELQPNGGVPTTRGWLAAVALPPPGSRAVLPHEDTFPAAVEGRRALLAATGTDLEPIVLAHDPDPVVADLTEEAGRGTPTIELTDADGVAHRLWRMDEPGLHDRLRAALGRTSAVIADGHHRFAAAQANQRRRAGAPGSDAVLALLTPMGPGGLRVEAIHRVVPELSFPFARSAAAAGFSLTDLPADGTGPHVAAHAVHRWLSDPSRSGVLITDGRRLTELSEPSADVLATVPAEAPSAWRSLDVVVVHKGLLEHLWHRGDDPAAVLVSHDPDDAVRTAAQRSGVAVLLRPPSPADVAAVARAGARMPRKSTLFVPKPRTGLVLRPHAD